MLERAATAAPLDPNDWESASRCVLLRWYAGASRALIAVQQLPAEARQPAVAAWIRHCFSSPEEHYMARARLLSYLCDLLGDAAPAFLNSLSLSDPWMIADAKRLARGQAPEPQ